MNINDVIKKPIITEKTSNDMSINKYTFMVDKRATKPEIKRAIEIIFAKSDAQVSRVNILNVMAKKATVGRFTGKKSSYKKAIVTLKNGSIPIFGSEEPQDATKPKRKALQIIDTKKLIDNDGEV